MSWLRRLSRDRSSKEQQGDQVGSRPFSHGVEISHPQPYKDTQYSSGFNSQDKLQSYRPTATADTQYTTSQPMATSQQPVRQERGRSLEPTPDPLAKAFNDAIRPFQDRIDDLTAQLEDSNYRLQTLEDERADMHAWIDKRGLRAGKFLHSRCHDLPTEHTIHRCPTSISQAMNTDPTAAATLNYQLDRKMTVLESRPTPVARLSLSAHLPTATFATTLAQLIPPIEELSHLPGGSPLAFELLIKLGGNLNSHGGDEGWNNEADAASRADFYARLDECMMDVVRLRLKEPEEGGAHQSTGSNGTGMPGSTNMDSSVPAGGQGELWQVGKDIKRLEKTGAFLRSKLGLREYFPRSLEIMKRGEGARMQRQLPLQGQSNQ